MFKAKFEGGKLTIEEFDCTEQDLEEQMTPYNEIFYEGAFTFTIYSDTEIQVRTLMNIHIRQLLNLLPLHIEHLQKFIRKGE